MYNFQCVMCFVLICVWTLQFCVSTDFEMIYNKLPDRIRFHVKSDNSRYHITKVECGSSVYYGVQGQTGDTVVVKGILECHLYQCKIQIQNQFTFETINCNVNVTTGVRNITNLIRLINTVPESNSIQFQLEFQQIDCIDSFYIVLNSKSYLWTNLNLTKSLKLTGLSPCINYETFILHNYDKILTTVYNGLIQTPPLKLQRIEKAEFNPKTNLLTWSPSSFGDCTVKYLIIALSITNDEQWYFESEQNEYNLDILPDCSKYVIKIKPENYEDSKYVMKFKPENYEDYEDLTATLIIETGYKSVDSPTKQNIQVIKLNGPEILIKWNRSAYSQVRVQDYAIHVNGVWTTTTLLEKNVTLCNDTKFVDIYVCIAGQKSINHCVTHNYDVVLNKLVETFSNSSIEWKHYPPLYKMTDWGTITTDTEVRLNIKKDISSLSNANFTLMISEVKCSSNLVPSYKITRPKTKNDRCSYLKTDNCTKFCEFDHVPNEVKLNFSDGATFSCNKVFIALQNDVKYKIMARISTSTDYTDTTPLEFQSDNRTMTFNQSVILYISITVISAVSFIILTVVTLIFRKRNKNLDDTFIKVQYFHKEVNDDLIRNEFQSICDVDLSHISKSVSEREMARKNRINAIIPYDFNRVILRTGYINASYIQGYKREKQYIATQGPTDESVIDFWHMIVEQQCDGIVMLTNLIENGTAQCFQYFPDLNATVQFKNVTVKNIDETINTCFIKRILQITTETENRYIVHYQYIAWCEGESPEDVFNLAEFVENTGSQTCKSLYPIVVHSSCGTDRTGTYIALDLLFQYLHEELYISVCDTVKKLRTQRCQMVETFKQYMFLYNCCNLYYLTRINARKSI